ncbi:4'-phosphopantetheinyl transferase superfamily protein [Stieleria sp. ICT_E10.1]|uniref:4'-phosphopantetheinyl transferase family protein n=1 Tax=Stieleria sedimenti TaxID=2976331 RepID=UPI00217F88D4|nr:4'-phosphopantetheinyl transferase superfamily protein [Stieleria sedimenti]MCS7465722.1 4'-phosphopantetheinyl transferase superfamily protein [Stieleria sedimenti]
MISRCNAFWKPVSMRLYQRDSAPAWPSALPSWLSPPELEELNGFRATNRRLDWIRGRWCMKQLLCLMFSETTDSLLQWQIYSRMSKRRGCRPTVFRNGVQQPIDLSLAHCASITVAVAGQRRLSVDRRDAPRIGVDAVDRTELPGSFASTWFSSAERRLLQDHRWPIAAGWAAKEAVFKACNEGESFRPGRLRMIEFTADGCTVDYKSRCLADVRIDVLDDAIIAVARASVSLISKFQVSHPAS